MHLDPSITAVAVRGVGATDVDLVPLDVEAVQPQGSIPGEVVGGEGRASGSGRANATAQASASSSAGTSAAVPVT